MKLETDELAKNILLNKVNCEYCQNHLRCEFEDNEWWCTMSKETPIEICEQWEPPNLVKITWTIIGSDTEKNIKTMTKIHSLRKKLEAFNARG
jgi:hypothetical protein